MSKRLQRPGIFLRNLRQGLELRRKVEEISFRDTKAGRVVFNTVGCYTDDVSTELYYAYLMACAGYDVQILLDDYCLHHWDYIQSTSPGVTYKDHKSAKNRLFRSGYFWLSRKVFAHPKITVVKYSDMLREFPDVIALSKTDEFHALDSAKRYFQTGTVDLTNPTCREYYEASLEDCKMSKRVGRYVDERLKPDLFVTTHGIYSTWGPVYDYLKARNYQCIVYSMAVYRQQRVQFVDNLPQLMTTTGSWLAYRNSVLDQKQLNELEEYFASRFQATAIDTAVFYKTTGPTGEIDLKKGSFKYTYGMFPNVIWDGDLTVRNENFEGPLEWIVTTVEFFEKRPDLHLVIRFHPAEMSIDVQAKKLEVLVRMKLPHLDKIPNISIISSSTKLKTYDLIQRCIDIGMVYEGVLGLELPYMGIPVITAARSRYQGAGNSFEADTRAEYFKLLADPENMLTRFKTDGFRERACVFSYWYFFVNSLASPIHRRNSFGLVNYQVSSDELDPARNPKLRETLNVLLNYVPRQPG